MKGVLKIIALAAMIGVSTAAYAQQKSITITGIPNSYKGKAAMLAIAPSGSQNYAAYSLGTISGASTTFPLSDWTTKNPWNGSGNFSFIILIGETANAIADSQFLYSGQTSAATSLSQKTTSVQWAKFGPLAQQSAQTTKKTADQKSITVTGIPNNYKGKTAMLGMAQSASSQSYTAYSLGAINGASVTFPLVDMATDTPWTGSGNFVFIIIIGETPRAIADKQYIYTGQTAATSGVNKDTTTVQWSQFIVR
jgi:hypothetical protein